MYYMFIVFLLIFTSFGKCELIFIREQQNNETFKLECIVNETEVNTPITWVDKENYPILYTRYNNDQIFAIQHYPWTPINLLSEDIDPITDKRWEDFDIIQTNSNYGYDFELGADKKHLAFSVYSADIVELTFYSNQKHNFSVKLNNSIFTLHKWNHLNLKFFVQNNTLKELIMGNKSWNMPHTNFGLIDGVTLNSKNNSFWKIHNYSFYYSTKATNKVIALHRFVKKEGPLCLQFYTSMCKNCSMNLIILFNSANLLNETLRINTTENWEWKETKFYFQNKPSGLIKIYVDTYSSADGFWAIDLRKCDSANDIRLPAILIPKNELNSSVRCESLTKELELQTSNYDNHLLSNFCGDYQICNNSTDCKTIKQDNSTDCHKILSSPRSRTLCPVNTWGTKCDQKCGHCLTDCNLSSGKCDSCQRGFVGDMCIQPINPSNLTYAIVSSNIVLNWIYPFYLNQMVDHFIVEIDIVDHSNEGEENLMSYSQNVFNSLSLKTEFNYSMTYNVSIRAVIENQTGVSTNLQIMTPPSRAYFPYTPFINNCNFNSCYITIPKPENIYSNSKLYAILLGINEQRNFSHNNNLIFKHLFHNTAPNNLSVIELPIGDYKLSIEYNNKYNFINNSILDDNVIVHLALVNIYGGKFNVTTYQLDYKEDKELLSSMEHNLYTYLLLLVLLIINLGLIIGFFIWRNRRTQNNLIPNHEYSYPVFQGDRKRLISSNSTTSDKVVKNDRDSYYEIPRPYVPPTYIQPLNPKNTCSYTHIYEKLQ